MPKIGFISIGHKDYDGAAMQWLIKSAKSAVAFQTTELHDFDTAFSAAESYSQAVELLGKDIDAAVIFLASWVECPAVMSVVKKLKNVPLAVWGVPLFEFEGKQESTGSYVSFAMFKGALDYLGYSYCPLLCRTDDAEALESLQTFFKAASCKKKLDQTRIGIIGYASMSMYTGMYNHMLLREIIGPEAEHADSYTLIALAEQINEGDAERAKREISERCCIATTNSVALDKTARIYSAVKQLTVANEWRAINIKCQYEFSKGYKAVPCVALSALASKELVTSCESDVLNTVSMLILNYLSSDTVGYGDVISHDEKENTVKLSSCGFIPFEYREKEERRVNDFMPHPGFTGIQCSFCPKSGTVTVMRLIEDRDGYHILYFTGDGLETPLRQEYMPAVNIKINGSVNTLIKHYNGQHFAFCYGDWSAEIEALANVLRIKAVKA